MSDVLYDAAKAFSQLLDYDYKFVLGNSKRQKTFTIISNEKEMFTHVCGLEHLTDVPDVTGKKESEKVAIYKNILKKNIVFSDIADSAYLYHPMSCSINPQTNSNYNIYDRIVDMSRIETILDDSYSGAIYKWDYCKCCVRYTKIMADYVLVIPSKIIPNEKHYFFLVQINRRDFKGKNKKDTPIKTIIISAFSDGTDLVAGQFRLGTILEVSKIDIKNKKTLFTQTYPSYQKEKDELAKKQSESKSSNGSISPTDEQKSLCLSAKTD